MRSPGSDLDLTTGFLSTEKNKRQGFSAFGYKTGRWAASPETQGGSAQSLAQRYRNVRGSSYADRDSEMATSQASFSRTNTRLLAMRRSMRPFACGERAAMTRMPSYADMRPNCVTATSLFGQEMLPCHISRLHGLLVSGQMTSLVLTTLGLKGVLCWRPCRCYGVALSVC